MVVGIKVVIIEEMGVSLGTVTRVQHMVTTCLDGKWGEVIAVIIMTGIIKMVVSTEVEKVAMLVVMRCKMVNSQYRETMGKEGFHKSSVAVVVMEEEQNGRHTYNWRSSGGCGSEVKRDVLVN
ncbi:hypothetical protein GOP47_0005898 [Adiantum capillus-veneris]|uniref:Uncharacterized protein n=1 Tax=Adiantum capillus-veneris TaxID=13818 RepID=A0A9D4V2R4_ADICA|nr:hypothetical protein GOP47_0005898 [Adiantum capillus-veneris]